jgi:dipeptidyl aminopeptidase/acylaminoacyl peptidase
MITTTQDLGEQGGYRDQIVSYPSDKLTQYALFSVPDTQRPTGGWPTIILLHGYMDPTLWETAGPEYRFVIQALTGAGYAVIKPDFQGNAGSEGAPVGGHFAPDYAYNTLNLITSLKHYAPVDAGRIGIFAHSMGGDVGLRTIVTSKDVVATAFVAGVVGSMYDLFYNWPSNPDLSDQPLALVQGARQSLLTIYGDPKSNPTFWDSASAINYVKDISGSVQINQDVSDSVVPKIFADHLNAALIAAGRAPQYVLYPGDDHQFTTNRAALLRNILAFYQSKLGAH